MITNLDEKVCFEILDNNCIGHLAYVYNNSPYIVPITYYYDKKNLKIICYSSEGHKTNALRENNLVALEVSDITSINQWKSILVKGIFEESKGTNAKNELHRFSDGVKKLIKQNDNEELHFISEFSGKSNSEALPIVFHINLHEITGKERFDKKNSKLLFY